MRLVAALAIFTLAGCRSGVRQENAAYAEARGLLNSEHYEEALPIAEEGLRRSGTEADRWRFRLLNADILLQQRQAAKALAQIQEFGKPPEGPNWAEVRAHLLLVRGRAASDLRQMEEAEQLLAQAGAAAKEAGSEQLVAEAELQQGRLWIQQGRFDDARRVLREVAEAANRLHDPHLGALAVGNLGANLLNESRNDEAIPWLERAIELFTQAGAADSSARAHGNLAICYFRLGDYDNARQHYQRAQDWFTKTGNLESRQIWLGNAANIPFTLGDYDAAAKEYEKALAIARQLKSPVWVARWVNNLAETSLERGDWDAAEKYAQEALETMRKQKDSNWEPTSLVTAARIAEGRGDGAKARALFQEALGKRAEDPTVPLDAHAGLARTWVREGRMKEAEREFGNTVAAIEERRAGLLKDDYKLPYLASLIRFYRDYVDFLVANHQPERALEVAESSRSRVLESRAANPSGMEPKRAGDYRRLAREMHAVALEYWLGPRHSYLWVIRSEGIELHELAPRTELRKLMESYRAVITGARNPLERAGETGQRLFAALVSPAGVVGASGRILVVPDEELYSFDLETLPAPGDARKFWIEQATLMLTPSLNFLAGRKGAGIAGKGLLAMGDAPGGDPRFPRLEFAGQEMEAIAASVGKGEATILRGAEATPEAYGKAGPAQFQFIHFAAHAMANSQSPLDSAVILAGPGEGNRLAARSVMAVPLEADLVTISACRSAGGRTYAGEGLVGFAWAFLRAGARNVIAGLWDVEDRSTAELMASLYRNIGAGQTVADALRAAKLELIHKGGAYAKPFYWAPFQMYVGTAR